MTVTKMISALVKYVLARPQSSAVVVLLLAAGVIFDAVATGLIALGLMVVIALIGNPNGVVEVRKTDLNDPNIMHDLTYRDSEWRHDHSSRDM